MKNILAILIVFLGIGLKAQDIDDARVLSNLRGCYDYTESVEGKSSCIGVAGYQCQQETEGGFTTLGQTWCQASEARAWDVLLNVEYRVAMDISKSFDAENQASFPEFTNRAETLRNAQRAWIPYRDALCIAEYAKWGEGSMRNIAASACQVDVTATRTIELWNMYEMMR